MTVYRLPNLVFALLFSFGLAFFDTRVEAADDQAGTVLRTQGSTSAQGATGARTLREGAVVYGADTLRTGSGGRLEIRFSDDSVLTLGENSELVVRDYYFAPEEGKGSESLDLIRGVFLIASGQIAKQNRDSLKVTTPVATIGIRGTQFWGGAIDGSFSVLLLKGQVIVSTEAGSVVLNPGQGVSLKDAQSAPGAATVWPDDKKQRAFATVAF